MPSPTQRHLISLDSGQVTPCAERSLSSARSERPFLIGASSPYTLTSTPPYAFCTGMEWLALGSLLEDDRLASPSAGRHSLNITFGSTCQPYDTVMEQMQCSLGCNLQKQISLAFAACRLLLVTVCVLGHTHTKRERPWGAPQKSTNHHALRANALSLFKVRKSTLGRSSPTNNRARVTCPVPCTARSHRIVAVGPSRSTNRKAMAPQGP